MKTYPIEWASMRIEELAGHLECPLCHAPPHSLCTTIAHEKRNAHRERWNLAINVQTAIRASEGLHFLKSLE